MHKYGLYDINYHDIGIYESDNPYIIVILTSYGNLGKYNFAPLVSDISEKVYILYNINLNLKQEYCQSLIY